ncbi:MULTISPECIES: hypothetical protein [Paraburkholderia]|uniref:hypothetical protein n=1 Tax=Paraburkholderia TaxID=1822464 RepID=UPI0022505311|nr:MULTISPECIES: hypothetical protein [Paraburkholderia]MCX4163653.1 hypothetical protein [Paraburkholderia megapolitana]MDN7159148.1 hypothetical protein [Paraburkholderia sp. CHISQ3]MDQ6496195.1 hypothetical protein [Paraburkholderia megapolitana]
MSREQNLVIARNSFASPILGDLASKLTANSRAIETTSAIIRIIAGGKIPCFRMIEDGFDIPNAALALPVVR